MVEGLVALPRLACALLAAAPPAEQPTYSGHHRCTRLRPLPRYYKSAAAIILARWAQDTCSPVRELAGLLALVPQVELCSQNAPRA